MSFVRLLPIILLLPVLTMAGDSDKNFKVNPNNFVVGSDVEIDKDWAISVDATVLSEIPSFPLKNKLYLRHKLGAKEYQWMTGKVNPKKFKELHAFSLKENYLKTYEVIWMRFYGSLNMRAFQDEADIYFDKDYIYTSRVPRLYFMKNGQWQMLRETQLPGIIEFCSDNTSLKISSLNVALEDDVRILSPMSPGPYAFIFSMTNSLPYVDIGVLETGKVLSFRPMEIMVDRDESRMPKISMSLKNVYDTKNLEETEALYDLFVQELVKDSVIVDNEEFEGIYPRLRTAASIGVSENHPVYKEYVVRYKAKKEEARQMWREKKLGIVSDVNKALREKLDSLESLPLRVILLPTKFEPVYAENSEMESSKVDSSKIDARSMVGISLRFGENHGRYDVAWSGIPIGLIPDSLYAWFKSRRPGLQVFLTLENDKPAWFYKDGRVVARHQYRYVKLEFQMEGHRYDAQGSFVLPDYILENQEVQEWLKPKPMVVPVSSSSEASSSSMRVVYAKDAEMPVYALSGSTPKFVRDKLRGTVALIDSGSFRYRGHVVSMSPFAIMTTEMTQQLFQQTMNRLDSAKRIPDRSTYKHPLKPVHNITWEDAREVCLSLDGDLPTEAQWEFAGRADNNEGAIWVFDSIPDPGAYAVYRDNSYNKSKRSEEFGPQQVASKKSNAWGLFDMSGNVAEWTRDRYFALSFWIEKSNPTGAMVGFTKVYKGGSWKDPEKLLNLTNSDDEDPRYWSDAIGFRCVYPKDVIKEK